MVDTNYSLGQVQGEATHLHTSMTSWTLTANPAMSTGNFRLAIQPSKKSTTTP